MSGSEFDTHSAVAITDPGEINRKEHLWGDRLVVNVGNAFAWLFPILMVAIVTQVIIRKMGHNQAWLDDAQWWMYGLAMIAGFGYAITTNSHVRVDIFHAGFHGRRQARIEVFALGWLLLPFLFIMTDVLMHYAFASIASREGSDSPNGLHGLFLLKSAMPVLFVVAIVATIASLWRYLAKFTTPTFWKLVIGGLPGFWFLAERACYYTLWWVVRFNNPELNPRKIAREPLMENTVWYGLALVVVLVVAGLVLARRSRGEG